MEPSKTPDADPVFFGRRKIGRYELLTPLASGGMGTVFAARTTGIGGFERLVAIKVLHPHMAQEAQFITMFLDEARLAARIRHPNVVSVLDVSDGKKDGFFLVMDYVEGANLGVLISAASKAGKRLPPPVGFRIVMDALSGLRAAHRLKDKKGNPLQIVHRDISPQNMLVGLDGVVRLTDFGIAKAEERLTQTHHGSFKGKAAYASPEQVKGKGVDQRSDLFSMGIVLWEVLAGRRLFSGDDRNSISELVLTGDIPALSSIKPDLAPYEGVLEKALARDVEERFQTAEEFLLAIEEVAGTEVAAARAVSEIVLEYAGEKLRAEEIRINEAAESVGVHGILRGEAETTAVKARDSDKPTAHGSARPPPGRREKKKPAKALLVLVLVLSAAVGWLAIRALRGPAPDERDAQVSPPADSTGGEVESPQRPDPDSPTSFVGTGTVADAGSPEPHRQDAGSPSGTSAMVTPSTGGTMRPTGVQGGMGSTSSMRPYDPDTAMTNETDPAGSQLQVRPNPYLR